MNACQVSNSTLDPRPPGSICFLNSLNHLLLAINPVQVIPQNSQAHWLQDVGVLQGHTVRSCHHQKQMLGFCNSQLVYISSTAPPLTPTLLPPSLFPKHTLYLNGVTIRNAFWSFKFKFLIQYNWKWLLGPQ